MKNILKVAFLLCLLIIFGNGYCYTSSAIKNVKEFVEKFCLNEFQGELSWGYRPDPLFKYTPETKKKIADIMDKYLDFEYLEIDPLYIVDSYKIEEIKQIDKKHAYAIVVYHQLAIRGRSWEEIKAQGVKYKNVPVKDIRDIKVKLMLEYDGRRWWVIDPPASKVSYNFMIDYYQTQADSFDKRIKGQKKEGREYTPEEIAMFKKSYREAKYILELLHSLKK